MYQQRQIINQNPNTQKMMMSSNLYENQDVSKFALLDDKYYLYKTVGSGATCKVKLGYIINSGRKVALKILKDKKGSNGQLETSKHYFDEINMLKKISHNNVID